MSDVDSLKMILAGETRYVVLFNYEEFFKKFSEISKWQFPEKFDRDRCLVLILLFKMEDFEPRAASSEKELSSSFEAWIFCKEKPSMGAMRALLIYYEGRNQIFRQACVYRDCRFFQNDDQNKTIGSSMM